MSQCLVIERSVLEQMDFWGWLAVSDGVISDALLLKSEEVDQLLGAIAACQTFMERDGDHGVEVRPEWQQIIFYGVVRQGDRFLVYQRGTTGYQENRLHSKLSVGVGGHIEESDDGLIDSLVRELAEELELWHGDSELGVEGHALNILGVIKDERDEVGKVHLGLVCELELPVGVTLALRGEENAQLWMVTLEEYHQMNREGFEAEGWTQLVVDQILS